MKLTGKMLMEMVQEALLNERDGGYSSEEEYLNDPDPATPGPWEMPEDPKNKYDDEWKKQNRQEIAKVVKKRREYLNYLKNHPGKLASIEPDGNWDGARKDKACPSPDAPSCATQVLAALSVGRFGKGYKDKYHQAQQADRDRRFAASPEGKAKAAAAKQAQLKGEAPERAGMLADQIIKITGVFGNPEIAKKILMKTVFWTKMGEWSELNPELEPLLKTVFEGEAGERVRAAQAVAKIFKKKPDLFRKALRSQSYYFEPEIPEGGDEKSDAARAKALQDLGISEEDYQEIKAGVEKDAGKMNPAGAKWSSGGFMSKVKGFFGFQEGLSLTVEDLRAIVRESINEIGSDEDFDMGAHVRHKRMGRMDRGEPDPRNLPAGDPSQSTYVKGDPEKTKQVVTDLIMQAGGDAALADSIMAAVKKMKEDGLI